MYISNESAACALRHEPAAGAVRGAAGNAGVDTFPQGLARPTGLRPALT